MKLRRCTFCVMNIVYIILVETLREVVVCFTAQAEVGLTSMEPSAEILRSWDMKRRTPAPIVSQFLESFHPSLILSVARKTDESLLPLPKPIPSCVMRLAPPARAAGMLERRLSKEMRKGMTLQDSNCWMRAICMTLASSVNPATSKLSP